MCPPGEEVFYGGGRDRKEAFDLALDLPADHPAVRAGTPMLGPNVWPDLPGFKEDVEAYYQAVFALGRRLLRGFALALGLPEDGLRRVRDHACPASCAWCTTPTIRRTPTAPGIGAHTDYECFTILLPTAPGLEVMNGAGDWVDAPPLDGAFVVNMGDLMEIWTNGTFVATSHRVRPVREDRYSFPLFFCCDYETEVAPLPAFVGPDRPALHAPVRRANTCTRRPSRASTTCRRVWPPARSTLPRGARPLSSFGQAARQQDGRGDAGRAGRIARRPRRRRCSGRAPAWTLGCFRRRAITFFTGETDTETQVIWLQARGADRRSAGAGATSLPDWRHAARGARAGRAERARRRGGRPGAHALGRPRDALVRLDQLPAGRRVARARPAGRVGDCLIEFAPSGAYVEDWRLRRPRTVRWWACA